MELTGFYTYLFFDSILTSLIFLPNNGLAYIVMSVFGYCDQLYMIIIAIVGNAIGSGLNYSFGYILREVKKRCNSLADTEKLRSLAQVVDQYLIYLNIFSFLPIWGVIITSAGGFFQISLKKMIFIVLLGRIAYYCLPIILF